MKKVIRSSIAVSAVAILVVGCATTRQDWEKARVADTVPAYEEFLAKNPQAEFSGSARDRIAELHDLQDWRSADSRGTPAAYEEYLKKRANGQHAIEARQAIADFQRYAPKQIAGQRLSAEGKGAVKVDVADPQTEVFIVPWPKGLTLENDDRVILRDALLSSAPSGKGVQQTLTPGRYAIAVKKTFPRQSTVLSELGASAPGNLFVAPSKDSNYELVVGGGIKAGALFKSVRDVYLVYRGAFFAQGPGTPNSENLKKYKYLKLQGTTDIMFRFLKGEPTFELWLLSECEVKTGIVCQASFTMPSE